MADASRAGDCEVDGSKIDVAEDDSGPKVESGRVDIVTSTYPG